ncbi:MAG TPA: carboxypeptidase regulatory-like domain-containing protein [Candidatus Acidoferrales bacterium]|nr:carboxypeptidase regulatory-like domain-containing protein [Candidatus Acidoferrales bacterium]
MRRRRLALSAFFVLTLAVPVLGQTPDTATVHGRVTDQAGAAVPGAQITITNNMTEWQRSVQSDSSGAFSFAGLPVAGTYTLTAQKQNFATATLNDVALIGGTTAETDLRLNVAGGATQVMVTGTVGEVRSDEPQLGDVLSEQHIQETPLLNRRITYLPLLEAANRPAINQGDIFTNQVLFTTNGTGRRQQWYEVDGSNAVDMWGRQTIFSNMPEDSVQEMTVLTNAFSAEYGFTAGSVVNIVSKSGGTAFHGDVLGLFRPSGPEAKLSGFNSQNATSGNDLANDTLSQTAAAVSGPIGSNSKTYFSADFEYSWQNRASPVISPIAPGNFIGHYRGWLGFIRIDHQINDHNNLFFRSDVDSFHDTNPNGTVGGNTLPTADRVFKRRTYTEELGETAELSQNLVNAAHVQFQLASPITEFSPTINSTQFVVPITTLCGSVACGTFTTGTSQSALLLNRQYDFNDTVSWVRNRNSLKVGADVIHAHNGGNSKEFGGPIYLGSFTYLPCTDAVTVCETTYLDDINNVASYTQSYGNANYTVGDTLWALFVQDDYQLRPGLTINLGLRYEQQTFTDSNKGFAPRVGFAYNVHGDGRTVIRGGFGIYYSQIVDNSEANYALTGPTGVFNYTAMPGDVGFPTSVSAAPLPGFPAGAVVPVRSLYIRPGESAYLNQFFPTSVLIGYPNVLLNPYTEQWTLGVQRELAKGWVLSADYVGSHTIRINRPLDVDPPAPLIRTAQGQTRSSGAANATRPLWVYDAANGITPAYSVIQSDVNDGVAYYNALDVDLSRRFSNGISLLASYTFSHAIDSVDPDVPGQNPNDPNFTGREEIGNAIYDQRHRFVLSGVYAAPFQFHIGGVATLASGLPYNIVTGSTNSGDTRATTDRPVINGVVIGRNAGRGTPTYDFSPFVERPISFSEHVRLNLRVEAFNVFNHPNFVGFNGTYGNGTTPGPGFGAPLAGITNQLPAREIQFLAKLMF